MESCLSVQRELDKVETKFTGLHDHYSNTIEDFISSIENIRRELAEGTAIDKNHGPFVTIFLFCSGTEILPAFNYDVHRCFLAVIATHVRSFSFTTTILCVEAGDY